jgi:hypothetical protein
MTWRRLRDGYCRELDNFAATLLEYLPSIVEGVDEKQRSGTGHTSGGQVTGHPLGITVTLLLEGEHRLVSVAESEVESLCWEISDDVGSVTSPQRHDTLVLSCSAEAVDDAIVFAVETASLQHLILQKCVSRHPHIRSIYWSLSVMHSAGKTCPIEVM